MLLRAVALFCIVLGGGWWLNGFALAQTANTTLVSGHVVDSRGTPVGSAVIQLLSWNGNLLGTQVTDAVGYFSFRGAGPGPFTVKISTFGGTEEMSLDGEMVEDVTIHLRRTLNRNDEASAGAVASRVSVNDLEASSKAKAKLAGAQKAMLKRDFSKAWKLVNEAITAAPNWGRAYMTRGVLSMESHNFASAKTDLATAVARDPDDSLALTELGKLYAATGKLDLSETYLRRALTLAPVLWPTYFEMASLDLQKGNFAEAETMADDAMTDTPAAPPPVHFLAAEAAYHLHEWGTANQEYRSFIALAPPNANLNGALALARKRIATLPH